MWYTVNMNIYEDFSVFQILIFLGLLYWIVMDLPQTQIYYQAMRRNLSIFLNKFAMTKLFSD
jgi:hypothetical protein